MWVEKVAILEFPGIRYQSPLVGQSNQNTIVASSLNTTGYSLYTVILACWAAAVFLAQLAEIIVYKRTKAVYLSLCLSICVCVLTRWPKSWPLHVETCNHTLRSGHTPQTTPPDIFPTFPRKNYPLVKFFSNKAPPLSRKFPPDNPKNPRTFSPWKLTQMPTNHHRPWTSIVFLINYIVC